MKERCKTCRNRGSAWCSGCEYHHPGLEQFDFYNEVRGLCDKLVTDCPFPEVFQDTERLENDVFEIPRLKIGHIRADYSWRWRNTVWPCHNELATDEIKQEIDEVYTALTAKDALADLDTLKRFCQSHPEACADTQFKQEYNFCLEGECCNFWIRLITRPKDYNLYLHVFAKSRPK